MSWRELSYLTMRPRLVLIGGLLLLPLVMPGLYWQRVISIVCIYALLALSFDFLAHYVGLVSLGGAFFVGVGGYLTALLNTGTGGSAPWSQSRWPPFSAAYLHPPAAALSALEGRLLCHRDPHVSPVPCPGDRSPGHFRAAPTGSWASTAFPMSGWSNTGSS